jgi:hypothetical protein
MGQVWTYGLWAVLSLEVFTEWLKGKEESRDPWFYAFIRRDTESLRHGAFMRCDAANRRDRDRPYLDGARLQRTARRRRPSI